MHILMFGWEFPPRMSGGLGTACYGMTRALAGQGHRITFVLPRLGAGEKATFVDLRSAADIPPPARDGQDAGDGLYRHLLTIHPLCSSLSPYLTAARYRILPRRGEAAVPDCYGPDLIGEVIRYGRAGGAIAEGLACDLIHAHDWMAVPAALAARRISGKPLLLHVHSLEYDRSGAQVDEAILALEREGLEKADRIIAVSHRTRRMIVDRYGIAPEKVSVVHNAVSRQEGLAAYRSERRGQPRGPKTVLFLGRVTFQKGPDTFVEAAAKVLAHLPETRFIMAGDGDMLTRMIERVAALGIGDRFHFAGFLQGEEIERIFTLSDLYVMPSVSEPFGIAPLEAMLYDVPVIISRQSGVAEIIRHALKVDFWDVDQIAARIIAVLTRPVLADEMTRMAREELRALRWDDAALRIAALYRETAAGSPDGSG
jgi:glycosyltransferase involved in cell wall biosynthesis